MTETLTKKEMPVMNKGYKELALIALELALKEEPIDIKIPGDRYVIGSDTLTDKDKRILGVNYRQESQKL